MWTTKRLQFDIIPVVFYLFVGNLRLQINLHDKKKRPVPLEYMYIVSNGSKKMALEEKNLAKHIFTGDKKVYAKFGFGIRWHFHNSR